MSRKFNVLFISSWYPNKVTPTNGDFVQRHAKAVSVLNNVKVLHVQYNVEIEGRYYEEVSSISANFNELIIYFNIRLKVLRILKPLFYLFYYLKGFRKLYSKNNFPDIVHANIINQAGIIAYIYKIRFKVQYVISEHWSIYLPISKARVTWLRRHLEKTIIRDSVAICPVTDNLGQALKSHNYFGRYITVPNVVDTDLFSNKQRALPQVKSLLHVSTLTDKSKNISGLLRVVSELSKKRTDFILNIVGGDELESHMQLATELHILNRFVVFHGEKDHAEIPKYLSTNHAFVMFSNYESLPCVIVEALACGLPVLATDVGGIKEHINISNGVLVAPSDEKALLESLIYMLDNFQNYNSAGIRQYAIENFSELSIAQKFNDIYCLSIKDV